MKAIKSRKGKISFSAVIEKPDDGMDTAYVSFPFDVKETFGTTGHVKVSALFDDYPYRGLLANMGTGCHVILLRKDVRAAIGKQVGDKVKVELTRDTEERKVAVPPELQRALDKNPKAKSLFESLSYTNKKEYVGWITSAKKEETRERRLSEITGKLLSGKKNPSKK